jgi:hypothetical protein
MNIVVFVANAELYTAKIMRRGEQWITQLKKNMEAILKQNELFSKGI